jgi:hypothetical protein
MLDFVLVCCSRVSCEFKTLPFKLPWNVPLFMCCLSPARPGGPFKLGCLTDPGKSAFREIQNFAIQVAVECSIVYVLSESGPSGWSIQVGLVD